MSIFLRTMALGLLISFAAGSRGQSSPPTGPQVHVRWIVDLKKELKYDSFERVKDQDKKWKQQQGVVFLTPEKVLVYQMELRDGGDSANEKAPQYAMQADIFDARDGHHLKRFWFPAKTEAGKIMATQSSAFVVQSGDSLTLYSDQFQPVASKDLQLSKTAAQQEWQIDVSPSGTRIVTVHQQDLREAKQTDVNPESKADIEILDSTSLKTLKSLSVPYLDQWSAEDDAIITTDPEGETGNTDFGIMDFDGKWHGLHTPAENEDADCPYHMQALPHQLIVAHDCDDLAVVSQDGSVQFSQPVLTHILISVAGADHFLAQAMVEPRSGRVIVMAYDLAKRKATSWVSLEKRDVYYAVSALGTLAVVDGDRLKLFESADASELTVPQKSADRLP